jgi:hypothetical protein
MPYAPTWTNGNAQGRLTPAVHFVRDEDASELALAINRRRRLVYLPEQDFSSQIGPGKFVRAATLDSQTPPPFRNFRGSILEDILTPQTGGLGGEPPTPAGMEWLWPVSGQDENKVMVPANPLPGQVGLMEQLNGTDHWTDVALAAGQTPLRAVHFNELRQALEWITRGRWRLPVYFSAGIFSVLPNTPWIGDSIANNGVDELRSLGFVVGRTVDSPPLGPTNATVRPATLLQLTADTDCQVEVYHCLRQIDFVGDPPTWNQYDPSEGAFWTSPGGTGPGDADMLGSLTLTANVPAQLSNAAVTAAVQAMIDGGEQNFLLRRSDTGYETIGVAGELVVEFDLDSPPN